MDTYSEIINEFNSSFSTNASLCEDLKVGWDLSLRVNQEFLDSTNYILHPELFFNVVSNNLVSLDEQEKRELMNKARRDCHFDDPLKKWW